MHSLLLHDRRPVTVTVGTVQCRHTRRRSLGARLRPRKSHASHAAAELEPSPFNPLAPILRGSPGGPSNPKLPTDELQTCIHVFQPANVKVRSDGEAAGNHLATRAADGEATAWGAPGRALVGAAWLMAGLCAGLRPAFSLGSRGSRKTSVGAVLVLLQQHPACAPNLRSLHIRCHLPALFPSLDPHHRCPTPSLCLPRTQPLALGHRQPVPVSPFAMYLPWAHRSIGHLAVVLSTIHRRCEHSSFKLWHKKNFWGIELRCIAYQRATPSFHRMV
jgi:hypothetical protein